MFGKMCPVLQNRYGSGGGAGYHNCIGSGTGGKGIVAIRYKFQA